MNEVVKYLKTCGTFYLATDEDGQPHVRPFGAVALYQNHVYLVTSNQKKVYRQLQANNRVELCGMHPDGTWMRIRGKVLWDDSKEAKIAMLEQNPDLKRLYQADDGKMEVCHLVEAEATLYSLTADPISVAL